MRAEQFECGTTMQDYRKLAVWQSSHELTLAVYRVTIRFPKDELFGLTSQMRRSSSSIPTNIAEGCGRATNADFTRFLHISLGSANELEYQLLLCRDLGSSRRKNTASSPSSRKR